MLSSPWGLWLSQTICPWAYLPATLGLGSMRLPLPPSAQVGEVFIRGHSTTRVFIECPAHVTQDWAERSQCWSAAWALLC